MSLYDRNTVAIRGKRILHSTARRDYVCGECGSKLATRFFEDAPNWRTVCIRDETHHPDSFVTSASWEYRKAERAMEAITAREVFDHLPAQLQEAILTA